jgi:holo-[acyl-carrier protein] synthase
MKLSTGVDLIEIDRVQTVIARHGEKYLNRIYTSNELEQSSRRPESLAVRFAAKEAVSKALGCGIGEVAFKDIEVLSDEHNAPVLRLHGAAERKAGELGLKTWSISLSHDLKQAIVMVVAIGD